MLPINQLRDAVDALTPLCSAGPLSQRLPAPTPDLSGTWSIRVTSLTGFNPVVDTTICDLCPPSPLTPPVCQPSSTPHIGLPTSEFQFSDQVVPIQVTQAGTSLSSSFVGSCPVGGILRTCEQSLTGSVNGDAVSAVYRMRFLFPDWNTGEIVTTYTITGSIIRDGVNPTKIEGVIEPFFLRESHFAESCHTFDSVIQPLERATVSIWVEGCVVPPGGGISEEIPISIGCDEDTVGLPVGPSFEDEADNKIQLFCEAVPSPDQGPVTCSLPDGTPAECAPEYRLRHFPTGGSSRPVGRCPWGGGQNFGFITHAGSDGDTKFDCFLRTFWLSVEPPFVPPKYCTPSCQGFGCQGFCGVIDFKEYDFDVQTNTLVLRHFTSPDGPGGQDPDSLVKELVNVDILNTDPPAGAPPMTKYPFALCDNDKDGDCDTDDFKLVTQAIGQCRDGNNYNILADADHDGCVTETDRQILFPTLPNQSPIANAGPDRTVECTSPSGANVMLDGTASSDPDGDTLTFTWTGPFGTADGPKPTVTLPLGTHTITLAVDDGKGGTASDTVSVKVVDTTPPNIASVTANPNVLWSPNHQMMSATVAASASDICSAEPVCQITSVSSNEPINGLGDGDQEPDWEITGNLTVNLRGERSGTGNGRAYTITVGCTDASGNSPAQTVTVTVPRDQKKK